MKNMLMVTSVFTLINFMACAQSEKGGRDSESKSGYQAIPSEPTSSHPKYTWTCYSDQLNGPMGFVVTNPQGKVVLDSWYFGPDIPGDRIFLDELEFSPPGDIQFDVSSTLERGSKLQGIFHKEEKDENNLSHIIDYHYLLSITANAKGILTAKMTVSKEGEVSIKPKFISLWWCVMEQP